MSEKSESSGSEKPVGTHIPKPSGIKPPASVAKTSRICCAHDKKPDLPSAATPSKPSEYKNCFYQKIEYAERLLRYISRQKGFMTIT